MTSGVTGQDGDGPLSSDGSRAVAATPPVQTWCTWQEACIVVTRPRHLRRTVTIALVVGTILFAINQLDVVLHGNADAITWIKAAVTYLVPFCVSSAGLLVGTHRHARTQR